MILRKPYAFFIKMFRPIHLVFAICIGFLIVFQNRIVNFLNRYLYSNELINTKNIKSELFNSLFYIIPIFLILLSLLMFLVMYKKNKPFKFYFISIFVFLAILVVNIYTSNFLTIFQKTIVEIRVIKLIHDFLLMSIIAQSILIVFYIIRAFGINFKRFDFSSDIAKFDVDEKDKEEFELELKFDFNETRRKRREKIRKIKYFYLENKLIVNIITALTIAFLTILTIIIVIKSINFNREKKEYNIEGFNITVENTYLLNSNYEGARITDNYLVVVDIKVNSYASKNLYLKDLSLKIGNIKILPTKKFYSYLKDIGYGFDDTKLSKDYENYILVYEISPKYISSKMRLRYTYRGQNFDIKLKPKDLVYGKETVSLKNNDTINFNKSLGDISFNIKNYEINDFYKINYNYCLNSTNCYDSIEYLRPSIDENYDKTVLKLDIDYENNTKLGIYNFYSLLNDFGDIYYQKNGEWKIQSEGFEQISSKKGKNEYVYIGINSDIKNSESIKFVFSIRGMKYEYLLK